LASDARRMGTAAAFALGICALNFAGGGLHKIFAPAELHTRGYMDIGLWAKRNFAAGTVIGSSQTGALGYFADTLRVVNRDGVVSKRCLESLEARRNMDYIREQKVQYVLGWESNLGFIANHSMGFREEDLPVVQQITEFESWGYPWYVARVTY